MIFLSKAKKVSLTIGTYHSIAIGYVVGSKRLITYAKDLNNNGTMAIAYNWVNVSKRK